MFSVTTIFEEDETLALGSSYGGKPVDSHRSTYDGGKTNSHDIVATQEYLRKLRTKQEHGLNLKQKLDLVMQRSNNAAQLASSAIERIDDLALAVSRINQTLERLVSPSQDPPGSSIFDEDVLEWNAH